MSHHTPVLLSEVLDVMKPHSGGAYIDATAGEGGHTEALLHSSSPDGYVVAIDQDEKQCERLRHRLQIYGARVEIVCGRFSSLSDIALPFRQAWDGILFDLGYSSGQLLPGYGLNYADDTSPLDMRLSSEADVSAAQFLMHANETTVADILYQYGDRHDSRVLARKLVAYRKKKPFQTAHDIKEALGIYRSDQLAPIFQALRIYVNDEYGELKKALPQATDLLGKSGVLAVISFHSGEDRIVKNFLRTNRDLFEATSRTRPSPEEVRSNPRARSAFLRVGSKK